MWLCSLFNFKANQGGGGKRARQRHSTDVVYALLTQLPATPGSNPGSAVSLYCLALWAVLRLNPSSPKAGISQISWQQRPELSTTKKDSSYVIIHNFPNLLLF